MALQSVARWVLQRARRTRTGPRRREYLPSQASRASRSPGPRRSQARKRNSPLSPQARRGELVIVGTGIKLVAHTTVEALEWITRADVLLYAVNEPATEKWMRRLHPAAMTLADCYAEGKPRQKTYREMVERMLAAVRSGAL